MNALRSCTRGILNAQRLTVASYTGTRCIARWRSPALREIVRRKKRLGPQPVELRSDFLEWNQQAELHAFNVRLSEEFDPDLLLQSFTFRSYVIQEEQKQRAVGIENPNLDFQENTELIEEGQRLTEKIIKAYLCQALPKAPEECIYALLDYLMSEQVVANTSLHIGTKDLILTTEYPVSSSDLACTFFALVTALSRSPNSDLVRTANFVRDFLIANLAEKDLSEIWVPENAEDTLNNILTRENREIAEPRLIGQAGVNTLIPVYNIGFYSNKEFLGKGFGATISEAREIAAIDALHRMFNLEDSRKPMRFDISIDISSDIRMENLPLTQWCTKNVNKILSV